MTTLPPHDATGVPLNQLYFYLTDACNLRCRHCWIEPHYSARGNPVTGIDTHLFTSILDQAVPLGLTGVKLTGGEPLLHPNIDEILDTLHMRQIGLTVETNGTLCTPELAQKLASFPRIFVSVSLDGTDAETHDWIRGINGAFSDALRGIENLVTQGIRPQIIMTLMRHNQHQIERMVRLAEKLGAQSVKLNILQPTARGERLHTTGETPGIEDLISLGSWVDNVLAPCTPLSLCFHQPPAFRSLGKMFGSNGDGCHACGILGILGVLADGSYALCGIGATVPEFVFGHAASDTLAEVWNHHVILRDIRKGMPERLTGVCAQCLMKKGCLGSCIAQNFYRSRDLWAPFWYCEEAYRKGLFPESRLRPGAPAMLPENPSTSDGIPA